MGSCYTIITELAIFFNRLMTIKKIIDVSRNQPEFIEERVMETLITSSEPSSRTRHFFSWLMGMIALILVWQVLLFFNLFPFATFPHIDSSKVQAVFLTNGFIYFGKLEDVNFSYVAITNAYSLQNTQQNQTGFNLIKLADEAYKPEDKVYIPKTQISFWENLHSDSPVTKLIIPANK